MFSKERFSNKITIKFLGIKIFSYYVDLNEKGLWGIMFRNLFTSFRSWFIPNKIKRKHFRRSKNTILVENSNTRNRKEPIEPWAFIRVKNEIVTIDTCLKSILPAIKKGVIAFNDCDDGSEEYIKEFCRLNPGFIPMKYPYCVYSQDDSKNLEEGNDECKLHGYYNATPDIIPDNEWIIKIDTDQIYDAEKLKKIFYLPRDENDAVILTRINLHFDGKELYFIKECPYLATPDHCLIYNNKLEFELKTDKKSCKSVEHLNISAFNLIYPEMNNYHFPMMKEYRKQKGYGNLVEFDEFIKSGTLQKFIEEKKLPAIIDPKMLDKKHIMSICKTFNMESKRKNDI